MILKDFIIGDNIGKVNLDNTSDASRGAGAHRTRRDSRIPCPRPGMTLSRAISSLATANFHLWAVWSPWEKLNPAMKRTFGGQSAGVGAKDKLKRFGLFSRLGE
jgi:hypothetical protein